LSQKISSQDSTPWSPKTVHGRE